MPSNTSCMLHNCEATPQAAIPLLATPEFHHRVCAAVQREQRVAALFGQPSTGGKNQLLAVMANGPESNLSLFATAVDSAYPALTPNCPQAHWFEREIAEQCGVKPEGHPWLKPVRFQPPPCVLRQR